MAPRDRTAEFHSALGSIKARTAAPAAKRDGAKQPLLPAASGSKSEFGRLAGNIAKDINATTQKLQKLAQCGWGEKHSNPSGEAQDPLRRQAD